VWHAIAFHAMLVAVFNGWAWSHLNVVCITHALGKILRQVIDMWIGHPPRSADSQVFGAFMGTHGQSTTEHLTLILLFSTLPITYMLETGFRRIRGTTPLFDIMTVAYVAAFGGSYFVHTKPGYRLRSLWRKQHSQHIGSPEQLTVPLGSFVTYTAFWGVVLAVKLSFDYFLIMKPLKNPVKGLFNYPFHNIMWNSCSRCLSCDRCGQGCVWCAQNVTARGGYPEVSWTTCEALGQTIPSDTMTLGDANGLCIVFEPFMRYTLVALRLSVPLFVFYFDTYIFFNVCTLPHDASSVHVYASVRSRVMLTPCLPVSSLLPDLLGGLLVAHRAPTQDRRCLALAARVAVHAGECA
jgi:hypothetical protein